MYDAEWLRASVVAPEIKLEGGDGFGPFGGKVRARTHAAPRLLQHETKDETKDGARGIGPDAMGRAGWWGQHAEGVVHNMSADTFLCVSEIPLPATKPLFGLGVSTTQLFP